ncbi:unnamed protein product [Kuraishia capsulata CBS 1993]|uniref:Mitochondrial 15S rRNA processing factor CCM1 n=1 Tax=Kuraishia capsulata CBS 1993 TaxID=1382522 RepID=W6MSZ4_9ASCO|nr:uncharacterized protein KUCA_T00000862001 [Kuraishia capsulata CBS 1993]CDK24895.1 unnamed protein product [Kuraishia capsulata CBS 1993]
MRCSSVLQFRASSCYSGRIRNRVERYTKLGEVRPYKSKWEDERTMHKEKALVMRKNLSQVKNASAVSLTEKTLGLRFDEIGPRTPFTEEQLNKLYSQPNKRLLYNVLGTTGWQLQDSMVVKEDTLKFLRHGQPERAMLLARMAKENGASAMDSIMQFYLEANNVNKAFEIFTERKRMGIPLTDFTLTILFKGCSGVKGYDRGPGLTQKQGERLRSIFTNQFSKDEESVNVINANACLLALFNCPDSSLAFSFFDSYRDYNVKPDVKTLTIIFTALKNFNDKASAIQKADSLFSWVIGHPRIKIDPILAGSYICVYTLSKSPRVIARGMELLKRWFKICPVADVNKSVKYDDVLKFQNLKPNRKDEVATGISFAPLDKVSPIDGRRYTPSASVLEMAMLSYDSLKLSQETVSTFQLYSRYKVPVELRTLNMYLRALLRSGYEIGVPAAENVVFKAIDELNTNRMTPNSLTLASFSGHLQRYILDSRNVETEGINNEMFKLVKKYCDSMNKFKIDGLRLRLLDDVLGLANKIQGLSKAHLEFFVSYYCTTVFRYGVEYTLPYKSWILLDTKLLDIIRKLSEHQTNTSDPLFHAIHRLYNSTYANMRSFPSKRGGKVPEFSPLENSEGDEPLAGNGPPSGEQKAFNAKREAIEQYLRLKGGLPQHDQDL